MFVAPTAFANIQRRVSLPALGVVALVVLAYHYSLLSLARGLTLQTPLSYLALVPVIAVLLAWVRLAQEPGRITDQLALDYLLGRAVGVGLIGFAVALALLVPISVRFWLLRVDLLSMPLFVAGLITLFFGVRRLWSLRFPIAFLLLAWPAPYLPLVGDWLDGFTDVTVFAVGLISVVLPFAQPAGDTGLFFVHHSGESFPVVVASACAGVNSLVGFALVGTALAYVVTGPFGRRLLWLAAGLAMVWLVNVLRIELIFVVGSLLGRQAALDVLHPVAGLLAFNLGIFAMLSQMPRFGLYFRPLPPHALMPAEHDSDPKPRIHLAFLALAGVLACGLGVVNGGYSQYQPLAGALGTARLLSFDTEKPRLAGWSSDFVANFRGGQQFFGESSTWRRVQLASQPGAVLQSNRPIYLDVIDTDDPNSLAAYGLEACYQFHGYLIASQTRVELAEGVSAEVINYHNPKRGIEWSAIWWEWPYDAEGKVRYERVVIFVANGPEATFSGDRTAGPTSEDARFGATDRFLAAIAQELVWQQLNPRAET